jgi:hypothetical protein
MRHGGNIGGGAPFHEGQKSRFIVALAVPGSVR